MLDAIFLDSSKHIEGPKKHQFLQEALNRRLKMLFVWALVSLGDNLSCNLDEQSKNNIHIYVCIRHTFLKEVTTLFSLLVQKLPHFRNQLRSPRAERLFLKEIWLPVIVQRWRETFMSVEVLKSVKVCS